MTFHDYLKKDLQPRALDPEADLDWAELTDDDAPTREYSAEDWKKIAKAFARTS